jgi:hypothetical protein
MPEQPTANNTAIPRPPAMHVEHNHTAQALQDASQYPNPQASTLERRIFSHIATSEADHTMAGPASLVLAKPMARSIRYACALAACACCCCCIYAGAAASSSTGAAAPALLLPTQQTVSCLTAVPAAAPNYGRLSASSTTTVHSAALPPRLLLPTEQTVGLIECRACCCTILWEAACTAASSTTHVHSAASPPRLLLLHLPLVLLQLALLLAAQHMYNQQPHRRACCCFIFGRCCCCCCTSAGAAAP